MSIANTPATADMSEGAAMPDSAGPPKTVADVDWFTVIVRMRSTALVRYFARHADRVRMPRTWQLRS